jgi:hypothetical protein
MPVHYTNEYLKLLKGKQELDSEVGPVSSWLLKERRTGKHDSGCKMSIETGKADVRSVCFSKDL